MTLTLILLAVGGCDADFAPTAAAVGQPRDAAGWVSYGGAGGQKYSDHRVINKSNVAHLTPAWIYRTGDIATVAQATPIVAAGRLLFCTSFNQVIALDPLTGGALWQFDAVIDRQARPANEFNCRGVAVRLATSAEPGMCRQRVYMATNDARLMALDLETGALCAGFGQQGVIDLSHGVGEIKWAGEYQVTSPPVVAGDVVIVGSAVSDGNRVAAPSGVVRGYDARSGELVWAFDLAPPGFDYARRPVSSAGYALGTPNVWSVMSVDAQRDLVFLPTGNPSPDYDRGANADLNHYGSSVVALRASSGEVVWHFPTVINDLWDFDVPAQPVLADLTLAGVLTPVVIQATKMGFVFVLHRETGEPVLEVTYRDVPVTGPLADQLSPVQPFPPAAFQVSRSYQRGSLPLGLCNGVDDASVLGPVYTPITERWTVGLPSNMGAINWGGVAVDAERGLLAVNTNSVPFRTRLIKRADAQDLLAVIDAQDTSDEAREQARERFKARFDLPDSVEVAPQHGSTHLMARHMHMDPWLGAPCSGAPLAEMLVIDINEQRQVWRKPHGNLRDYLGLPLNWGAPGMGGPMLTAGGLVFVAAAAEKAVRAYDVDSGEELWYHRLPHPGNATPTTYTVQTEAGPRQFVVLLAGGDARSGMGGVGDYLVSFALPQQL
ncbi:MAG: PQQ-binding-like beta-propeller repeat protein [Pseudomonadota bacterium]